MQNSEPPIARHSVSGKTETKPVALSPHKLPAKTCLYLKRLDDAHLPTLKKLIKTACKSPEIAGAETIA